MKTTHTVSAEDLQAAHDQPVLKTELLPDPITIESMQLLRKDGAYMVRARSTDGAEGLSFCNAKAKHLYPILNQLVIPYFIGKDARDLEDHLWEVYRHSSNYKLLGQALWNPVAWVEMAILDLIGLSLIHI